MTREEDPKYRSTGSRTPVKTARRVRSIGIAPRRRASVSLGNDDQAAAWQRVISASLIADLSASFVGIPVNCIDDAILGGLRQTVEALGVDHGAFYQSTGRGLTVAHAFPAQNPEAISYIEQADNLTWLADVLRHKGVLKLSQSKPAASKAFKDDFLCSLGLKSVVLAGVIAGGTLLGALMLGSSHEEAAWTDDLDPTLQILGAVFAEALSRKQYEERLLESDHLSHAMLDTLDSHIVVVDQDAIVVAISTGKHFNADSDAPFLCGISTGANYFDACRAAIKKGLESTATLLGEIDAVIKGSRERFEMECEFQSASGPKFFRVSVTRRMEAGGGAVISHIETTERRRTQTKLRELSGKTITSLEDERRRIARELHDEVSQRLALMGIEIEQIMQALPENDVRRRLKDLWGHNQETSLEVRRLSHNLHSSKLEYLGLVAAVKSLCNDLSNHHGLRIRFKHVDVPPSIPKDVALCIYRVVQESLRNVIKHSGASEAQVALSGGQREINLCISDEGSGFDIDDIKAKAGIGLIGIRERLQLVGGEVSIESQPSRGTRIAARVSLREQGQNTKCSKATN
jgi:signal transduction histidine kinase